MHENESMGPKLRRPMVQYRQSAKRKSHRRDWTTECNTTEAYPEPLLRQIRVKDKPDRVSHERDMARIHSKHHVWHGQGRRGRHVHVAACSIKHANPSAIRRQQRSLYQGLATIRRVYDSLHIISASVSTTGNTMRRTHMMISAKHTRTSNPSKLS